MPVSAPGAVPDFLPNLVFYALSLGVNHTLPLRLSALADLERVRVVVDPAVQWAQANLDTRTIRLHPDVLKLTELEVLAVFAHEVAHLRATTSRRALGGELVVATGIGTAAFFTASYFSLLAGVLVTVLTFLAWVFVAAYRSRASELAADAEAGRLLTAWGVSLDGRALMAQALQSSTSHRTVLPRRFPSWDSSRSLFFPRLLSFYLDVHPDLWYRISVLRSA